MNSRVQIDLPVITEKDKVDLVDFGLKHNVDFVAASVQSAADVIDRETRGGRLLDQIISKIENQSGLNNFAEILEACDGIMSQGDLGMEIPMQKFLSRKS